MDLRKRRSQQKLQVALAQHLQTQTIDEITIGELTHTAGVSRQTFYSNFDSKQSILVGRVEDLFFRGQQHYDIAYESGNFTYEDVISLGIKFLLRECDKDRAVMRAAFTGEAGIQCLTLVKKQYAEMIANRVLYLFDYNFSEREISSISNFYAGALIGSIQGWLLDESEGKDLDFVAKQIGSLMPHGIDGYVKQLINK